MKGVTRYKIICTSCGETESIGLINATDILWGDAKYIISGRKRLDGNWGFECIACGNNDLLTDQERKDIKNLQQPDPKDIERVIKKLVPQKPRFLMEPVLDQIA